MRKLFGSLILLLATLFALAFFILFNIFFLARENKVKDILSESNFYDTAAFYIKNEIVSGTELQLNEGTNFEDLNSKINADTVKESVDRSVESLFIALDNPIPASLIFPIRFYSSDDGSGKFVFEKYANFENNRMFEFFSNKELYLLETGAIAILLIVVGLLVFSGKIADRLLILGIVSLISALILLGMAVAIKLYSAEIANYVVGWTKVVREAKLLSVVDRTAAVFINRQFLFYVAEFIGLLIIATTTLGARKIFLKESLQEIDKKI